MIALNRYIDHTQLKPDADPESIVRLCKEALSYDFYAVCVNSSYAHLACEQLKGSNVKVAATVGFPLGAANTPSKVAEAEQAVKDGADEVDMVLNIGFLKAGLHNRVKEDIESVKDAIGKTILKVIIETCLLSEEEKEIACLLSEKAGADFVKTSTGFSTAGATIEDIKLMKQTVGRKMKIKASGGIRSGAEAIAFIGQGAERIGTSDGITLINTLNP